jgi:hypothetical protein
MDARKISLGMIVPIEAGGMTHEALLLAIIQLFS